MPGNRRFRDRHALGMSLQEKRGDPTRKRLAKAVGPPSGSMDYKQLRWMPHVKGAVVVDVVGGHGGGCAGVGRPA